MNALIASLIFLIAFTVNAAEPPDPILQMSFNTTCGWCTNQTVLKPTKVEGYSGTAVNGGIMRGVTLTFKCVNRKPKRCCKVFTQKASVFVANAPMATQVGTGLPGVPK